jgi:hypothetical protein
MYAVSRKVGKPNNLKIVACESQFFAAQKHQSSWKQCSKFAKSVSRNIAGICKYLCVCHKFAEDLGNNTLCVEMLPEILNISGVFRTSQKRIASMYGHA